MCREKGPCTLSLLYLKAVLDDSKAYKSGIMCYFENRNDSKTKKVTTMMEASAGSSFKRKPTNYRSVASAEDMQCKVTKEISVRGLAVNGWFAQCSCRSTDAATNGLYSTFLHAGYALCSHEGQTA
jgi:hypothetical protein